MTKTRLKTFSRRSLSTVLALLMMISILGIGSLITVNGAGQYNQNWQAKRLYFVAPDSWDISTYSTVQVDITRTTNASDSNHQEYIATMTRVGTSRLFQATISANHSGWNQSEYLAITANSSSYGSGSFKLNANHYYTTPKDYGLSSSSNYYLALPDSDANGCTVTMSYSSTRDNIMKKTQTASVYTNKASSSTGGSVNLSGYYFSSDTALGSSSDTPSYDAAIGSTMTMEATANTGYSFDGWYSDDSCSTLLSSNTTYSYTVTGTKTVYANFMPVTHQVTRTAPSNGALQLSSNNSTWGTSALTIAEGANYYVKVTPNNGYKVKTLTVGGSTISAAAGQTSAYTYTGTMGSSDVAVSVTFEVRTYTITYKDGGNTAFSGTHASGAPTSYKYGTGATLKSASKTGYAFGGWFSSSDCSGTAVTSVSSSATGNKTFYAKWTANSYSITYKDQGDVAFSGTHASGYPTTHTYGTATTLKSASKTGYTFGGWYTTSACTGTAVTSLSATSYTGDITLYAKWTQLTYAVTINHSGATGSVTVDGSSFTSGSSVTHGAHNFVFTAPSNYNITAISIGGAAQSITAGASVTINNVSITAATSITVTYTLASQFSATLVTSTTGSGTGGSITTPSNATIGDQSINATVSIACSANTGYTFSGWQASDNTVVSFANASSASTTITVLKKTSVTITAKFTEITHTVSATTSTTGTGTGGSVNKNSITGVGIATTGTVTATANTGYTFSGWTIPSGVTLASGYSTSDTTIVFNATADSKTVTAKFTETKYTVSATTSTTGTGTGGSVSPTSITGVGIATTGTVTATANTGYTFTGWTIPSGVTLASGYTTSSATIKINATASGKTVTANFSEKKYKVTLTDATHNATVTNNAIGIATSYSVTAANKSGYTFSSWTVTGTSVTYASGSASSASISINARSNVTLVANYTENTYTVTVTSSKQNNVALGNVSPSSVTAGVDTKPTITAEAKTGYEFVNWTGSNLTFTNANNASTTVAATAAGTATANFRRTRLYLDVSANSTWKNATYYKAYFFQSGNPYTTGTTNGFISMTAVDGVEDLYYVDLPGTFNTLSSNYGFIFIAKTDNNNDWNNKTAQTADLTFDGQKNKYIIGASSNSWADSPYFPPTAYAVTVSATTGGSVSGNSITAPDSGTPYPLPTPEAAYGYKFTGWKLVSGSVTYDNTTYSTANTIFSTTAASSILANQASSVQAVFDYDSDMHLYIVGRFRVYNTYSGSPRTATYVGGSSGAWSLTATNIPFQYDEINHYYYVETNSSIAELSATLSDKQYFRVYDQTNSKNWQLSANQALTESNESTQYTMVLSGDKSFYFNQTSNANGPVKICFNPVNNKLWFTIPARHNATVSTITTLPGTNIPSSYGGAGGTLTVNGGASATVSEGTGYTITATPKAGYSVTSVKVNGTEVLPSVNVGSTAAVNISHAMGTTNETVTATFTAVQYNVTVGTNSTNSNNTIYVNTNGTISVQLTVEDTLKPIATAYAAGGYALDHIELRDSSDNVISGYGNVSNNTAGPMPAQAVKVYAVFKAIAPTIDKVNNTTVSNNAFSATAYAGQSITFTPHSSTAGSVTFALGGTDSSYVSVSGTTYTFTVPTNIGPDTTSTQEYSFTITPTNTPETGMSELGTAVTITVNASYSTIQQKYLSLYNAYKKYNDYNIDKTDTILGDAAGSPFSTFSSTLSTARSAVLSKINSPNYMIAWNSSDMSPTYDTIRTNLENAYSALDFKQNTVYVLVNSGYSSNVKIQSSDSRSGWFTDKNTNNRVGTSTVDFRMTYEGATNSGKHLYSFTYYGKSKFIFYCRNGVYSSTYRLSGTINLSSVDYGEYYVDLKNITYANSTTTTYSPWADFAMTDYSTQGGALSTDLLEKDHTYTFSDIKSMFSIETTGKLVDSNQDVNELFTVRKAGTNSSGSVTIDSSHSWTPTESGRYRFAYSADIGSDSRSNAGANFVVGEAYYLYVAYDEVTIYADMNGNVGTPTIKFDYRYEDPEHAGTYIEGTLPFEFDLVTGSEYIYSTIISLKELNQYGIDLLSSGSIDVSSFMIDNDSYDGFIIDIQAAKTGTVWMKANSSSLTGFDQIAYSNSNKTFVAKIDGATTYLSNPFADISGTGIINDEELVSDNDTPTVTSDDYNYYQYNVNYAALDDSEGTKPGREKFNGNGSNKTFTLSIPSKVNDVTKVTVGTTVYTSSQYSFNAATKTLTFTSAPASGTNNVIIDYEYVSKFAYNVKVAASDELTDNNTTYCFDHWEWTESGDDKTSNDRNLSFNSAPVLLDTDDITYTAVYVPTSSNARVEVTYNFEDFDTSDGNYIYNAGKTDKAEKYVKTILLSKLTGNITSVTTNNATNVASQIQPKIMSNYYDYTLGTVTLGTKDDTKNIFKINADMTKKAHKYKIVVDGESQPRTGYYQQTVQLSAPNSSYNWYVNYVDSNNPGILVGQGSTYTATFGMYQQGIGEEGDFKYDTYTIKAVSGSTSVNNTTTIMSAHQEVFYDNNGTQKARHNFYIIDTIDDTPDDSATRKFVGGGVLYATTDSETHEYRQEAAASVLDSTAHMQSYISGILNPDNDSATAKYDTEFKPQTINNVGFRYLPYEKGGEDIFRYSNALSAYLHVFAGENTNSESYSNQNLKVFSFFIYKVGNNYYTAVSSTAAEVGRYVTPPTNS